MLKILDAIPDWRHRRRGGDSLARAILWDLAVTSVGFLMAVVAVLLTVQGFLID